MTTISYPVSIITQVPLASADAQDSAYAPAHGKQNEPQARIFGSFALHDDYSPDAKRHAATAESQTDDALLDDFFIVDDADPIVTVTAEHAESVSADDLLNSFILVPSALEPLKGLLNAPHGADVTAIPMASGESVSQAAQKPTLEEILDHGYAIFQAALDEDFEIIDPSSEGADNEPAYSVKTALAQALSTAWHGASTMAGTTLHTGATVVGAAYKVGAGLSGLFARGTAAQLPPRSEQNRIRAQSLSASIQKHLLTLNKCVEKLGAKGVLPPRAGELDTSTLTTWQTLHTYKSQMVGAYVATVGALPAVAGGTVLTGAGVGMVTSLFAIVPGLAAMTVGATLALRKLMQIPANAKHEAVVAEIQDTLPAINADIAALEAILLEEQRRDQAAQRMHANIGMRYAQCRALNQAITQAEKAAYAVLTPAELDVRANRSKSLPMVSATSLQHESTMRAKVLTQLTAARAALQSLFASLVDAAHALKSWMAYPSQWWAQSAAHQAQQAAEEKFRELFKSTLTSLSLEGTAPSHASAHAMEALKKAVPSTHVTQEELERDLRIGQALAQAIQASELGFGAVRYVLNAEIPDQHRAVPSNLMTVRAIARYIDAQAISDIEISKIDAKRNASPAPATSAAAIVSRDTDGAYIVADPEGKLYSFLAGAPTAYANLLAQETSLSPAEQIGAAVGRMTITDHSATFPGGARNMEFEPQFDASGAQILKMRFVQAGDSTFKPDAAVLKNDLREFSNKLVLNTPLSTASDDLTGMSQTDLSAYIDRLGALMDTQRRLMAVESKQIQALWNWEHPLADELIQQSRF